MSFESIDHLDLVVTDFERSLAFYRALLTPLGYAGSGEIEGERGERVVYLHRHGGGGTLGLRAAQSETGHDRYAPGVHHIAFAASERACVEQIAGVAAELGAEIESGPREYDYTPGYYAVFVLDPDGIKLEFVHRPAEQDLARRLAELEAQLGEARTGG
jgi:glyoxylase I family protein